MRPPIDDEAIEILREEVPEFELAYLDLLDIYDEDLTPEVVFMELADFVIGLLAVSSDDEVVERCFGAIELVATTVEDGRHLVGHAFLSTLSSTGLALSRPYLGEATADLLDRLDAGRDIDDEPALTGAAGEEPASG